MKIGQCYQCGKKIGRRLASGQFRYYRGAMDQVELVYEVREGVYTHVVVPVCVECADSPKQVDLETNIKKDKGVAQFKKDFPDAKFKKIDKQKRPEVIGD